MTFQRTPGWPPVPRPIPPPPARTAAEFAEAKRLSGLVLDSVANAAWIASEALATFSRVECAWCKATMREGDAPISHSICPTCSASFPAESPASVQPLSPSVTMPIRVVGAGALALWDRAAHACAVVEADPSSRQAHYAWLQADLDWLVATDLGSTLLVAEGWPS